MSRIAYILLCHKDVDGIIAKAESLASQGDYVSIHFDANAPRAEYERLRSALSENDGVVFAKRKRCGWGEWSLVDATLSGLRKAEDAFPRATHFYLISGDCMPIKTAEYIHGYLEDHEVDFIESYDFFASDWIKTGFREERLIYRHWFNERTQARRFYASFRIQQMLGLKRKIPSDLNVMIGSQWWCLRRQTVETILEFVQSRTDVVRFFRNTWIPDETFFQTLVRHLVPSSEIACRTPTFLLFSDYGMPVNFYNDHYDMLLGQDSFFARKASADALDLKDRLIGLYGKTGVSFRNSNEGQRLFRFLTGRGRAGERYGERFWESDSGTGRDRTLFIVASKKWHVAKRFLERVGSVSNIHAVEYLFDEADTALPDLGGIQNSLGKRSRHRRAVLGLLYDHFETDRMMICLDPSNLALLKDFFDGGGETRLLEIDCDYTDEYLAGHARRVGLATDHTTDETMAQLLPAIRNTVRRESELIRDQQFPEFYRIREKSSLEDNATAISGFLEIEHDKAIDIASTDYLFVD